MKSIFKYTSITGKTIENLKNNQIYFNIVSNVNDPYEGIIRFNVSSKLEEKFISHFYDSYNKDLFSGITTKEIIQKIAFSETNSFLGYAGISCFSSIKDSLVMWGNYANKHQGICIEYDKNISIFKYAQRVSYSNDIFCVDIKSESDINNDYLFKSIEAGLYNKSKQWEYEKEWRIIFKPNAAFKYPQEAIRAIYFGIRTSEETFMKTAS